MIPMAVKQFKNNAAKLIQRYLKGYKVREMMFTEMRMDKIKQT